MTEQKLKQLLWFALLEKGNGESKGKNFELEYPSTYKSLLLAMKECYNQAVRDCAESAATKSYFDSKEPKNCYVDEDSILKNLIS